MGSCKQQQPPHPLWLRAQNLQFDICQSRQSLKAKQRAEGCAWCFQVAFQHHSIHVEECFKMQAMSKKKDCIVVNLPRRKEDLFWIFKMQQSPFLPPLKLHSKLQILPASRRNWSRCDIGFVCCLHPFTSDFEVIFVCFLGAEDFS